MKSTKRVIFLLMTVLTILPVKTFSQGTILNKKISITLENETLKSAIKRIEKETGIAFAYSNLSDLNKKVSGEFTAQSLNKVLSTLFEGTNISFKEIAGKITLFETNKPHKKAQRVTIHGYITDADSGERLINANVFNPDSYLGTISNNFGFYSYSTLAGQRQLTISYIGYQSQILELELKKDTIINIALKPQSGELGEISVIGSQPNPVENTQISVIDLPVQKLEKIPVIMGETDVLKIIQLYPGVQAGLEGTSGIHVRGGSSDQNLFLVDGVPVYNANHLLGFFSTFNPYAVKSVNLYKGGFPARFGGRLSSVVDVQMKDGNMKKLKGEFSIGLLSSRFSLEGPVKRDKTSFMLSARRSYADMFAKPIIALINKKSGSDNSYNLYFYDVNAKLNHIFSDRSRIYWNFYRGKDNFYLKEIFDHSKHSETDSTLHTTEGGIGWSNTISSIKWNYLINNKLFSNTSLFYSKFLFDIHYVSTITNSTTNSPAGNNYQYLSGIEDLTAKIDFDYFPTNKQIVKFGIGATRHYFSPGIYITNDGETNKNQISISANEFTAYAEDEFSFSTELHLNVGLHLSLFNVEETNYCRPQPRISLHYKPFEKIAFKASASRMAQHLHLVTLSKLELPMDLWVPVTAKFEPPVSDQFVIGTAANLPFGLKLTVEGFYKSFRNLIEYKEGASFVGGGTFWENNVEKGIGWAYGAELLLEKTVGKTTGWLAYTWSKSERQFPTINFGKAFPYKYDRRHDISLVINHEFNKRIDFNATWVFITGQATTVALNKYAVTGIPNDNIWVYYVQNYNGRNGYRLPDYHRLDLGVNLKKEKKHGLQTWSFSLYNAYNRANAFSLSWRTDYSDGFQDEKGRMVHPKKPYILSLFPIIPSIAYSFKF